MENQLWLARAATLLAIALAVVTSVLMPGVGLLREPSVLGAAGILIFAGTQAAALYGTVSPWRSDATRRRLLIAFGVASVLSVPLVAPVAVDRWDTWAWVGAGIVGSAPLLVGWRAAAVTSVVTLLVGVGVAWWFGESVVKYTVLIVSFGLTVVLMSGLPVWLWGLLTLARVGQAAQARPRRARAGAGVSPHRVRRLVDGAAVAGHCDRVLRAAAL